MTPLIASRSGTTSWQKGFTGEQNHIRLLQVTLRKGSLKLNFTAYHEFAPDTKMTAEGQFFWQFLYILL